MTADDWPTGGSYDIQLDMDDTMNIEGPHVITFLRTGTAGVTVEFEVVDAENNVVFDRRMVTLPSSGSLLTGRNCECTGSNGGLNPVVYGASYGTQCGNWDATSCGAWWGATATMGPWCCQAWCYVSEECTNKFASHIQRGLYFSYEGACPATS